jgi:hypothetical protein
MARAEREAMCFSQCCTSSSYAFWPIIAISSAALPT